MFLTDVGHNLIPIHILLLISFIQSTEVNLIILDFYLLLNFINFYLNHLDKGFTDGTFREVCLNAMKIWKNTTNGGCNSCRIYCLNFENILSINLFMIWNILMIMIHLKYGGQLVDSQIILFKN